MTPAPHPAGALYRVLDKALNAAFGLGHHRIIERPRSIWPDGVLLAALLTGCAAAPPPGPVRRALPQAWSVGAQTTPGAGLDAAWWQSFGDPALSSLVSQALAANTDLRVAESRVRAARAAVAVADAGLLPLVTGSVSASRSSTESREANTRAGAGFDAAWELDLFGGRRAGVAAARADEAQAWALQAAVRLSVAAEAARLYVLVRAYQRRLALARDNLRGQDETLQLTQLQAQAGLLNDLDVEQARLAREQGRTLLPTLQVGLERSRHALAVLLDRDPLSLDGMLEDGSPRLPAIPDTIALGVPADLLRRRPDVAAAEHALAAATARVAAADAARRPSFALSGSIGLDATRLPALADPGALVTSLMGRLAAPVFDAGRLRQQVEIQSAAQDQALANYDATLMSALRDVEDALSEIVQGIERNQALHSALYAARQSAQLARHRQSAGLSDFSSVLEAERALRATEDAYVSSQADQVSAAVQLYKAMGGGWAIQPAAVSEPGRAGR